jgi:urease accessory protein
MLSQMNPELGPPASGAARLGLLRLLQVCSPAFPIGAFAYSQGLEQAVERGWVNDAEGLRQWCRGLLHNQLTRTDLPLLQRAMVLWASTFEPSDVDAQALALTQTVLAFRETAELRAEELMMGRSLARVLTHAGIDRAAPFVDGDDASYVVLFGLAACSWNIPLGDALAGYAFAWLENQLAAAPRVMRIGQLGIQDVLGSLLPDVSAASENAQLVSPANIGYSSPGFFFASAWHETQYSRLFRS